MNHRWMTQVSDATQAMGRLSTPACWDRLPVVRGPSSEWRIGKTELPTFDVVFEAADPRPLRVRIRVEVKSDQEIQFGFVEGDLTAVEGKICSIEDTLHWEASIAFPIAVPPPLLRELEQVMELWSEILITAPSEAVHEESDRSVN